MLRVLVLGAAAGGGFPQWNCNCEGCRRARSDDTKAIPALQASIAFSGDGENWFLVNASPDLRQQINDNPALHPNGGRRSSPIAGVLLTNGDVDAVAGLLNLREGTPFTIHAHPRVLRVLDENKIFDVVRRDLVPRLPITLDVAFPLKLANGTPSGLEVRAFPVPGKVALYLEDEKAGGSFGTSEGDTIGLEVRELASGASFFFVGNCAAVVPAVSERLRDAPLVFFDGTLWADDEMRVADLGTKTGQRMGHLSMSGPDGTIAALASLGIRRKVFLHINNSNPALIGGSAERAELERAGWEIPLDGTEIVA
ncbi:MAG: pyrroloquinoline quinone biosynthesis protein PqqB [Alphaproteobacteria bacterium]|nr:pyrroloquinoline quinone biosynthesis protein PqqB [Alphaproteobacteria bacterium]